MTMLMILNSNLLKTNNNNWTADKIKVRFIPKYLKESARVAMIQNPTMLSVFVKYATKLSITAPVLNSSRNAIQLSRCYLRHQTSNRLKMILTLLIIKRPLTNKNAPKIKLRKFKATKFKLNPALSKSKNKIMQN